MNCENPHELFKLVATIRNKEREYEDTGNTQALENAQALKIFLDEDIDEYRELYVKLQKDIDWYDYKPK